MAVEKLLLSRMEIAIAMGATVEIFLNQLSRIFLQNGMFVNAFVLDLARWRDRQISDGSPKNRDSIKVRFLECYFGFS
jgi:hypothetical protein